MERLICLLPKHPDEPWDKMSDQYSSSLWDIYPDTQVCGIGENDTIIVDGFRGALIQWSMFSTVHTTNRTTLVRRIIITAIGFVPILLFVAIPLLSTVRAAGGAILGVALAILLPTPLYIPHLFNGKLYEVEPCLFGFEGYIPLLEIEEMLFGVRLGRLNWSPYGSPLSRHRHREKYCERSVEEDVEAANDQRLLPPSNCGADPGHFIWTYPVEAIDPCSGCENCENEGYQSGCKHETIASVDRKSKSQYGAMKVRFVLKFSCFAAFLLKGGSPCFYRSSCSSTLSP